MKFSKLQSIVTKRAHEQRECAAYNGAWNDGGEGGTLSKLSKYKDSLVREHDLRPSEYYKLNDLEVGEPIEFSEIIANEKQRLARDIKL